MIKLKVAWPIIFFNTKTLNCEILEATTRTHRQTSMNLLTVVRVNYPIKAFTHSDVAQTQGECA